MADVETKAANQTAEEQTDKAEQNTEPEKKYSDDEVNGIVKKNSDKAIAKLLKDLGIEATDEGKANAKQILAAAKAKAEAEKDDTTKANESNEKYAAAMAKVLTAQGTIALIGKGVPAEKAGRFAKLLDLSGVADDNGEIDADKMAAAVDSLLKEWPEALPKADEKVGFKVGSNGKETKEGSEDAELEKWRKKAGLK